FQEYFAALFIKASPPAIKKRLIERIAPNTFSDSVLSLLYEIDPYSVEQHFLIPEIESLRTAIGLKRKVGATHLARMLKQIDQEFTVELDGRTPALVSSTESYRAVSFLFRYCLGSAQPTVIGMDKGRAAVGVALKHDLKKGGSNRLGTA